MTGLSEEMLAGVRAAGLELHGVRSLRPGTVPDGRILRYVAAPDLPYSYVDVADPVWISTYPGTWLHFGSTEQDPEHEAWRIGQALLNRMSWTWGLPFDICANRRVHIVGNGPSARGAIGNIAPGDAVIAINGALELRNDGLPVTWWCMGDAMFPPTFATPDDPMGMASAQSWLDRLRSRCDLSITDGIFTAFSYHEVVQACRSGHTWLGAHTGPALFFRHIVPKGAKVLTLTVSGAVICAMVHLAWRLGSRDIVLWGADCGTPGGKSGTDVRHAGLVDAAQEAADPVGRRNNWYQAEGVAGPYLTTPSYDQQRKHLDAVCLFLQDDGCRVWNASAGARLIGAPKWEGG